MKRAVRFGALAVCAVLVLTGCYFSSERPLFGPEDFTRLVFNKTEYTNKEGYIQIRQFGRTSKEFMVLSASIDSGKENLKRGDIDLYRAGFVQLADDLYLAQVVPLSIDATDQSEVFQDMYVSDREETIRDDTAPHNYAYIYVKATFGERDFDGTKRRGVEQFRMYAAFKDRAQGGVEALAAKHGISMDGYRILTVEDVPVERLKAFFLEVYQTEAGNIYEPDLMSNQSR